MSNRVVCREASHAGSWYTATGSQLNAQLEGWLSQAQTTKRPARAIIAPHAGYTYCGACAAFAYKQIDPSITRRVFILGPSHHVPLSRCALSPAEVYRTPLYDLRIDQKVYADLWKTGMFERMTLQTDEEEHSIEMQLPYTAKAMESHKDDFAIVPILVGALNESKEQDYGKLLSKYLADPSNLFVISSDFCHWGQRFRYTYYDETQGEIYRSIEHLDKMGMSIIEQLDPISFSNYLKKYRNTICGRHPIGVLLNAVEELKKNGIDMNCSFLNYAQSSQCRNWQDSSPDFIAIVEACMESHRQYFESQFSRLEEMGRGCDAKLSSIQMEFVNLSRNTKALKVDLSGLCDRVDKNTKSAYLCSTRIDQSEAKMADLEHRNRCPNLRMVALEENHEGSDAVAFLMKSLPQWFQSLADKKN
ncbi:Protein MEMO1 [Acipenser ruthenus]|uniref:Protein MEMO1 n=1 Tax=Acipenser ruthenus TaxID=7906 RepID=A0A662YJH0_ACIRT|nr:Protein MEMO1 [Acipenser ruthenus]